MALVIDNSKCIKCGKCVKDCVCGALSMGESGVTTNNYCINCQHCLAICPTGAISFDDLKSENCQNLPDFDGSEFDSLCRILHRRNSIRNYKNTPVAPEIISQILHELRHIPTGCNFHDLQIRVIGGAKLDELRKVCGEKIVEMLDKGEIKKPFNGVLASMRDGLAAGQDLLFRNAPYLIVVAVNKKAPCPEDGIIALSNFELLANSKKLGTCWCGVGFWIFKFIAQEMVKYLELDDNHTVAHAMVFGYPDVEYTRKKEPKDFDCSIIMGE